MKPCLYKSHSCVFFFNKCSFSAFSDLLHLPFRVYTNGHQVSRDRFSKDVQFISKKLEHYVKDYFKLNTDGKDSKKKIAGFFAPSYAQLVCKMSVLAHGYDYISIPTPLHKTKHKNQKYAFYLAENQVDLLLCSPFYKHVLGDLCFHLQIPCLIFYEKPDIRTLEEYEEDLREGKETFRQKYVHEGGVPFYNEMKKNILDVKTDTNRIKDSRIHLQLSKENECDKTITFQVSNIYEQAKYLQKSLAFNESDHILLALSTNTIQYYDILYTVMQSGATLLFPERNQNKYMNQSDYMNWFKTHVKKKDNQFSVHKIIAQDLFKGNDFEFVDGQSLFEEIQKYPHKISVFICNNYLLRDLVQYFEHSQLNQKTKDEFVNNIGNHVKSIVLSGNEIKPSISKQYVEKIRNIFTNAKIFHRYVLQEIGTVCLMEYDAIQNENIKYERNLAGYVLPNMDVQIDTNSNVLKVKSAFSFSEYYNFANHTKNCFDDNGFFKTKLVACLTKDSLLRIEGVHNPIRNLPEEYKLYYSQRRDKMEKMPLGYLKRVRLHGQIWGNFHANKRNWKRKF